MKVVGKQRNSKMCIICGMDNPIGLKAQFYNMEDESVMTIVEFKKEHQSFPGRVHGGMAATLLDELGLRALWAKGSDDVFGVTITMELKYRKPVPYDELVIGKGIVEKDSKSFITVNTYLFDKNGNVLVEALVKYMKMPTEKISKDIDYHNEMIYLIEDNVKEINFINQI